jgi:hypothetical protein
MTSTVAGGNLVSLSGAGALLERSAGAVATRRRRRVSHEAGRGIEMLGHAIEYLADEFSLDCMGRGGRQGLGGMHPSVQAIELLMARNREIYLSCPVAPTWTERLNSWLRRCRAWSPVRG